MNDLQINKDNSNDNITNNNLNKSESMTMKESVLSQPEETVEELLKFNRSWDDISFLEKI